MQLSKFIVIISIFFIPLSGIISQTVEIPVLQLVTVDRNTQQVFMKWTITQPSLVDGYIVKRQIFNYPGVVDGSFNNVADINNGNQFEYTDNSLGYGPANPSIRQETYRISAYSDITGTREFSNMSNAVSTIFLEPVLFDQCREQNSLKWTRYEGFGNLLDGYRVYYSTTQTGTPQYISTLPKTDTSYTHRYVESNAQYFYFIVAYSNSSPDSSISNIRGITTTMPMVPAILNADYASVEGVDKVNLSFTTDAIAEISAYKVLKSKDKNGPWDTIASFPRGTTQINTADYIKTNFETWYYKVLTINNCGLESRQSNLAHNIIMEANSGTLPYINEMTWTPYTTWYGGVENYRLFRSIDGQPFEDLASLNPGNLTYSDDITAFVTPTLNGRPTSGQFCYYVEANEGAGNPYGISGTSKSNISCVHHETIVYFPNAFNPKSPYEENRTFKPVISFVNDYKLIIYNRSGEMIFQNSDPMVGWDGTKNGKLQQKATYIYLLHYRTKDNQLVEKTGQINLVY